jgi:hypothetical protein
MNKFKVGQTVRIIHNSYKGYYEIGTHVVVVKVYDGAFGRIVVRKNGSGPYQSYNQRDLSFSEWSNEEEI